MSQNYIIFTYETKFCHNVVNWSGYIHVLSIQKYISDEIILIVTQPLDTDVVEF